MQPKKKTSPVFWIAIIGVGVAAYVFTTPEETPKAKSTKPNNTRKAATATLITEEDLKAKFERVNNPVKNAFMPVIKKNMGELAQNPSALPAEFTGGESGWAYTGTAEVDGRIQAVVENQSTGQGDFLSVGQNWKKAKVVAVTESTLILEGMSGQQVTVKMQEKLSSSSMMAGGFAPVNVGPSALSGQIGPVAVRPDGAGAPAVTSASEGEGNAN